MVGTDPESRPVGISRRQLNEHMLVVGRTGAGKTTLFYNVMAELDAKDVPFLVVDFKNDYRHVVEDFDLPVLNWRDLRFNPLQPPPGVPVGKWAEVLGDVWAHAMGVFVASKGYFLRKLRELYAIYDDEIAAGRYPSLFELRDLVRADDIHPASPRFNYKERLENRTTMLTGFSGAIFDCSRGQPIQDLLDRNVVLELQEPNRDVQTFVIEALLTWIFYYRDAAEHRQGLRHAILFDEAKQVFDGDREQNSEIPDPPITTLLGRVREFGEALIVADHEPSKLSDSLKANTNVKLWLSLGSGHDTEEMATTFGLDDDQVDLTRTLARGEAVLKTADQDPVPIQIPPYHVDKSAAVGDVRERMQPEIADLSFAERVRPRMFQELIEEEGRTSPEEAPADDTGGADADQDAAEDDADDDLGEVAEQLLASVNAEPFLSMSERYDAVDVGAKTGTAAKEELVTLGLVREVEIATKKPGRNPKLLALTAQGEQVLDNRGFEVRRTGRRGIEHRYWQQRVTEHYEAQGFDVEIEHPVEQGRVDVYAERADATVAVEVACSPEHEVENVRKCLAADVDRIEVVALTDGIGDRIEAAVQEAFDEVPDPVVFVPAADYA